MSLATGTDAILDDIFSYAQYNRIKNHFRGASAPAAAQPGSIFSDSDDDRLYHAGAASAQEEVLQLTRSKAASPQFATLKLMDTNASHSLALKWNEDRSADQTLNIVTGAADRTVTLSGNPTLADWFDQEVKAASSPAFVTAKLTALTDGYIPYHVSDAAGLANSGIYTNGTSVEIGGTGLAQKFAVTDGYSSLSGLRIKGTDVGNTIYQATGNLAITTAAGQGDILLGTTSSFHMTILNTGSVLIGATAAVGSEKMRCDGDAYFDHDVSALTFTDRV
jgi:hypothetical protein